MPVKIVIGGQFGSEGKGKITAFLSKRYNVDAVVRCGGPNSGHTVTINGKQEILRQIPAGVANEKVKLFLSAGCLINIDVLLKEIKYFEIDEQRIGIDRNAAIVKREYMEKESQSGL